MPSGITDHRSYAALPVCEAVRFDPPLSTSTAQPGKGTFKHASRRYLRATFAAVTLSAALSGCGVFCGGAGGSGGGFAGGCATGMRF
jgi:hypothetical protein